MYGNAIYSTRRNNTFGGDLRATDIQRGRDHGLGSYVNTRAACGLPVPKNFHEMSDYMSHEVRMATDFIYLVNILVVNMGRHKVNSKFEA